MSAFAFFNNAREVSPPFDGERADALRTALAGHPLLVDEVAACVLTSLAGHSPFLARLIERDADALVPFLSQKPDDAFEALLSAVSADAKAAVSADALRPILRRARRHAAVLIGLADFSGQWSVAEVTAALTHFADVATSTAVEVLLREAQAKGKYTPDTDNSPATGSGLAVIAMGKFGAGELNYSSDIDIVVFFDPATLGPRTNGEAQKFAVKLTRDLVAVLHEPTADGYVFRVDLRLRPDAGSTQVAISFDVAENYYEALGQNWERAAFIKARAVAGDIEAGQAFLKILTPFVWRKYLDFAAIEDIHSILRQIHSHGQHRSIAVEGHDVKLGLGGIREIEFFVQTQQLILGGREPELRSPRTVQMLGRLAAHGDIKEKTATRMAEAYAFFRLVEHRLQMVEDQQTHKMPTDVEGIGRIASFCGMPDEAVFRETLLGHLRYVREKSKGLFGEAEQLGGAEGSLVFTGVEDDPETLETLRRLGFERVSDISGAIRRWHHGRLRATRSARARERLTELMPRLLQALADTADADRAFYRFDGFLSGLPTGVQLFALLSAHPELLEFLADVFGTAPRLSNYLAKHPHVIDAMLDPDFYESVPSAADINAAFAEGMAAADDLEGAMNVARRLVREIGFRIGVQILRRRAGPKEASAGYSAVAEAAIRNVLKAVTMDFEAAHGKIDGGSFAVVALGKLGSAEMAATSDLDLIFVYDCALTSPGGGDVKSDGARPLHATTYFMRLGQRLVNAITAPTEEGKLFEVDLRLRPSGNKGPLATRLAGFESYHAESAWTWERMALTRARVVAGPEELKARIEAVIEHTLTSPRDARATRADIRDMRDRLAREFGTANPWDVKYVRGGLVDLEFIAQGLQLLHGVSHPEVLTPSTSDALERATGAGVLAPEDGIFLGEALELVQTLDHILRLALEGAFDPATAPEALKRLLARAAGSDFDALAHRLAETEARVLHTFESLFEGQGGC